MSHIRIDRFAALLAITAMGFSPAAASAHMHGGGSATADLVDGQGKPAGQAMLKHNRHGLKVTVKAVGLAAGVHAVHLHAVGNCAGPDFKSAGGHWNPGLKQHGHDNPAGAHMGDMPNMTVGADGKGTLRTVILDAMLKDGANALLDADGAAIVIHAAADDYKSDPAGNAGARLVCGVIR